MSSSDFFYCLGDIFYWLFINTLEAWSDWPWVIIMWSSLILFCYWMKRQMDFNKEAASNPNQIK